MMLLAFLFAAASYQIVGPGGVLHRDQWFVVLARRVAATGGDFLWGIGLLVGAPTLALLLLQSVAVSAAGGLGALVVSALALFFAFGRADYAAMRAKFMARCAGGDIDAAMHAIDDAGLGLDSSEIEDRAPRAARVFAYEGFQRWFAPVFYFFVLGPWAAVAYRLLQLAADHSALPLRPTRHVADWLPSRLLAITFGVVGQFGPAISFVFDRGLQPATETNDLLVETANHALPATDAGLEAQIDRLIDLQIRSILVWTCALALVTLI